MVEILIIIITVFSILYILLPIFFVNGNNFQITSNISELESRKKIIEKNIFDLDFDYYMGKISDEDYNSMRKEYLKELNSIFEK
jgi:uncharacterized membrane protein